MPDVRGLVGVDRRVLDAILCQISAERGKRLGCGVVDQKRRPIKENIQISRSSDFDAVYSLDRLDRGFKFLSDRPWILLLAGLLFDELRHLKRDRKSHVAKLGFWRHLGGDLFELDAKFALCGRDDLVPNNCLDL